MASQIRKTRKSDSSGTKTQLGYMRVLEKRKKVVKKVIYG